MLFIMFVCWILKVKKSFLFFIFYLLFNVQNKQIIKYRVIRCVMLEQKWRRRSIFLLNGGWRATKYVANFTSSFYMGICLCFEWKVHKLFSISQRENVFFLFCVKNIIKNMRENLIKEKARKIAIIFMAWMGWERVLKKGDREEFIAMVKIYATERQFPRIFKTSFFFFLSLSCMRRCRGKKKKSYLPRSPTFTPLTLPLLLELHTKSKKRGKKTFFGWKMKVKFIFLFLFRFLCLWRWVFFCFYFKEKQMKLIMDIGLLAWSFRGRQWKIFHEFVYKTC